VGFKNHVYSQWVRANGPYGGKVRSFAVSGGTIFAGTYGCDVFLSTNSGSTWTAINSGLMDKGPVSVSAFAVIGSTIFAGTYESGVYRFANSGANWT